MNSLPTEQELKTRIQSIVNFLNSSRHNEVIEKTIPLIKKFPQTYVLYNLLALAYNGLGKYEKAIEVLDKAIKFEPNNIFILNNLGLVHGNLDNNVVAEKYLKRALTIEPSFLDALITLADLKSRIDNNSEEILILEKAKKFIKKTIP